LTDTNLSVLVDVSMLVSLRTVGNSPCCCVVECSYRSGSWWVERLRRDKVRGNTQRTIDQTLALCTGPGQEILASMATLKAALLSEDTVAITPSSIDSVASVLVDMMLQPWLLDDTLEMELRLSTFPGELAKETFTDILDRMERRAISSTGWQRLRTHILDKCYGTGRRDSYDYETSLLLAAVYKSTIKTRNIRLLGTSRVRYSLRATLKEERPVELQMEESTNNDEVRCTRIKDRTRFVYGETFAFDFTRVLQGVQRPVYEVEVEVLRSAAQQPKKKLMVDMLRYTLDFLLDSSGIELEMT
jgi:hypothetical protein